MTDLSKLTIEEREALTDETAFRALMLIDRRELRATVKQHGEEINGIKKKVGWISAGISAIMGTITGLIQR